MKAILHNFRLLIGGGEARLAWDVSTVTNPETEGTSFVIGESDDINDLRQRVIEQTLTLGLVTSRGVEKRDFVFVGL